jgi:hypothetical protein
MKSNVVKLADFGIVRVVPEQVKELESSHGSRGNSIAYNLEKSFFTLLTLI